MNLEQLKYIVEVDKTKSISTAAQNLHVSQPGISKAITSLEQELGINLFIRSRSGVEPTEDGNKLLQKAYEVVMKLQEFEEQAQEINRSSNSVLKIAAVPGLCSTILLECFQEFQENYQQFNVDIEEEITEIILEDIKQDKINLGLIHVNESIQNEYKDLTIKALFEAQVYALVSSQSPLAPRDVVTPQDLLCQSIVIYKSKYVRAFCEELSQKYGEIKILFATNNTEVILKTVAEGRAINLAYHLSNEEKQNVTNADIKAIPLMIDNKPVTKLMGYVVQKQNLTKATSAFLKILQKTKQ